MMIPGMSRPFTLLVMLAVLAGCRAAPSKTTLKMLIDPDTTGGWKEIPRLFETAHPDIGLQLVEGPPSTNTREEMYTSAFLSGSSAYDVVWMDVIWTPKFAAAGWLKPLDQWVTPAQLMKDHYEAAVNASVYQGHVYRVPVTSGGGVLYYRKDLLEQGGFKPPQTWTELVTIAKKLQRPPERWGFVFQGQQYEGLICAFLEVLWGAGGDVVAPDGQVLIDRPEAVAALQWLVDAIYVEKIVPEAVTTYQEEECRLLFEQGHAVFMRNWPYVWTSAQKEGSPVKGKIGLVPMVHRPGNFRSASTLGGWGVGISKFSKHPEEAWKFVTFLSGTEVQKLMHLKMGGQPSRTALYRDTEVLATAPFYRELFSVFEGARPRPVHPRYAKISDILAASLSQALVRQQTPQAALRQAAQDIRRLLAAGS